MTAKAKEVRKILANRKSGDVACVVVLGYNEPIAGAASGCTGVREVGMRRSRLIPDDSVYLKLFDNVDDATEYAGTLP